jgi:hypothetical protein
MNLFVCCSDTFLRSLCVVSSLKMDKFPLVTLHARQRLKMGARFSRQKAGVFPPKS